jgi:hypothetical protein
MPTAKHAPGLPNEYTWEPVERNPRDTTDRMMLPGGWLYRTNVGGLGVAMTFVAVPDWNELEEVIPPEQRPG